METVLNLFEGNTVAIVIACVAGLQVILAAVKAALAKVKDLTTTNIDNKIYKFVDKVLTPVEFVVALLQGNK